MNDGYLNGGIGFLSGAIGVNADIDAVAIMSAVAAVICAVRVIYHAACDVITAIRRRRAGKTTTEEMLDEITDALDGREDKHEKD